MKDRQVEQAQARHNIPLISAVLHCVSMTAIVFLRSGFGYAFLKPKSVFFAFSWAFALFSVYAWMEPGAWAKYAALCLYGLSAIVLYWLHFASVFASELRDTAKHDNDSGTPHILRIVESAGLRPQPKFRKHWVLWAEPLIVLVAGLLAYPFPSAKHLSAWLFLVAPSLWLKEALNFWFQIRQRKRQRDAIEDAEDGLDAGHAQTEVEVALSSRKAKTQRPRVR